MLSKGVRTASNAPNTVETLVGHANDGTTSIERIQGTDEVSSKLDRKLLSEASNVSDCLSSAPNSFSTKSTTATDNNSDDVFEADAAKRRKTEDKRSTSDASVSKYFSKKSSKIDEFEETPIKRNEILSSLKIEYFEKDVQTKAADRDEKISEPFKMIFYEKDSGKSDSKENKKCDDDLEETEIVKIWDDECEEIDPKSRKTTTVEFSFDQLRKKLVNKTVENSEKESFRRFLAKINPNENEKAEMELQKEFKKEDFKKLKIFGQVRMLKIFLPNLIRDFFHNAHILKLKKYIECGVCIWSVP